MTIPIACTLTSDQQQCHAAELLPQLGALALRGEWAPEGMRLAFVPSTSNLEAILRTVERERQCCAFLAFRLDVPAAGAELRLEVSGPPGTGDFLRDLGVHFRGGPAQP